MADRNKGQGLDSDNVITDDEMTDVNIFYPIHLPILLALKVANVAFVVFGSWHCKLNVIVNMKCRQMTVLINISTETHFTMTPIL